MWRAAFLPWPMATVTVRSAGTMSPPAKRPAWPVIMVAGSTGDDAVVDLEARYAVEQREIDVLAEREHDRVGLERLELAGRLREALLVELHPLDRQPPARRCLIVDSHLALTPSSSASSTSKSCAGIRSRVRR